MANQQNIAVNGLEIRLWVIPGGVHPYNAPEMLTLAKISGDPSKTRGEATRITAPDPNNFDSDVTVGKIPGSSDRGSITLSRRYTVAIGKLLKWFHDGCRLDMYGLVGKCRNPQDFQRGGEKYLFFDDGDPSTITIEGAGAFGKDEANASNENLDMSFDNFWEVFNLKSEQILSATTTREVRTVDVCEDDNCGDCESCQRVMATMIGVGATPGTKPTLIYSDDGGSTGSTETIDTMNSNESIADAQCIGGDLVLITHEGNEIHYRNVEETYLGIGEWQEVDTGFVVGGEPNRMHSTDPRHTWIVGDGGYIYFAKNPRAGVSVLNAGIATTENLNYVHAFDSENVLVVGDSNTVLVSRNGGDTWRTVTGPSVGENLGVCWMWSEDVWFVGEGSGASGQLYKTKNAGFSWDEVDLPVAANRFDAIRFTSEMEGYATVRVGGNAKLLRTITGGYEWWEAPDQRDGALELTDYLRDIAVCSKFENTVFLAGLADDGSAGALLKASGQTN